MINKIYTYILLITLFSGVGACSSYRSNIMFQVPETHINNFQHAVWKSDSNSTIIEPFDILKIEILNKGGEALIDPEFVISGNRSNIAGLRQEIYYPVDPQGTIKLPLAGEIPVSSLSLRQAEVKIQEEFTKFYDEVFVSINFINKRALIFKGQSGMVIPLESENTTLIELIAISGGVDNTTKANNVRLIRGDQVIQGNLSTIEGFLTFNRKAEPGDILYLEPVRRPFPEAIRDYGSVIGLISSVISLTALIISFK